MSLRVTRQAYINAMIARGYERDPRQGIKASRREMRSHVCQQCHVEYYFRRPNQELTFPWSQWPKDEPLRVEMIEAFYDAARGGDPAFSQDWIHGESGAPMLKIQHPETELYSSGPHAAAGVACADCHMPYMREGAVKVSNHKISSPLFEMNAACQTCHPRPEEELRRRVDEIQNSTARSLRAAEGALLALIDDLAAAGALVKESPAYREAKDDAGREAALAAVLAPARELHRRAGMRWDFVFSENSTGFHSPQEAARVLAQAVDLARRGQLELQAGLQRAGLILAPTAGGGRIPLPGEPISGRGIVGGFPPPELLAVDAQNR